MTNKANVIWLPLKDGQDAWIHDITDLKITKDGDTFIVEYWVDWYRWGEDNETHYKYICKSENELRERLKMPSWYSSNSGPIFAFIILETKLSDFLKGEEV